VPEKNHLRRDVIQASQNFITSSAVLNRIVRLARLNEHDHVIEIGAGKGHITSKLIPRCAKVTAIEIDRRLYDYLQAKFDNQVKLKQNTLHLVCGDFLQFGLPKTSYKIFANIPFNRTTQIIRKLVNDKNPPDEAWLVVEKGAAKRFMGKPCESLSSLLIKPFFDLEIKYYFRRDDFHPKPSVDAVLLHLSKKSTPDVSGQDRSSYARFISECYKQPGTIYNVLTKKQISTALIKAKLSCEITPGETLYIQWLCLFRCYKKFWLDRGAGG
jgi:23S rRNA (adenine-N6)-dimethyltransferase